jgi:ribosomal protein S18 acetylase RimI-like enzyme
LDSSRIATIIVRRTAREENRMPLGSRMAMERGSLRIERLSGVDGTVEPHLNGLFDDGTTWDTDQGALFLGNPDNLFLLARWDGTVCGFLTAHRLQRFDRRRAEVLLYEIGVDEAYRRRGVGRALIAEAKRWAGEVGADEVWVLTDADNAAAMSLYAATGGEADPPGTTMFTYRIAERVQPDERRDA